MVHYSSAGDFNSPTTHFSPVVNREWYAAATVSSPAAGALPCQRAAIMQYSSQRWPPIGLPALGRGPVCRFLVLLANDSQVYGRQRWLDLEPFQEVCGNPGHREVAKPLAVRGDDEPGRPL